MTASKRIEANRRSVQLDIEVPGTPEEVWRAIATGPGISSWFVATEVDERLGGDITFHLGPGMDSTGVVTAWEAPRRFAYEERDWMPGAPPLATEFHVEARAGGVCRVRLVSSLATDRADWDDQLDSFETGWRAFLGILELLLTHFPGQPCSAARALGSAAGPLERAWAAFAGALGLTGEAEGEGASAAAPGLPALSGRVERAGTGADQRSLVLCIEEPGPGIAVVGVFAHPGGIHTLVSLHLAGQGAAALAAREERAWSAWMAERFPAAGPPAEGAADAG
jgi:uncharacterized protein YndB with AHSA1/START domain